MTQIPTFPIRGSVFISPCASLIKKRKAKKKNLFPLKLEMYSLRFPREVRSVVPVCGSPIA